jgi:hypothetical protein
MCWCMIEGHSILKSADISGVNPKAAFRWGVTSCEISIGSKQIELAGIVEGDETRASKSQEAKGFASTG